MPTPARSRKPRAKPALALVRSDTREEALSRARARAEADWRRCEYDLGAFIPRVSPKLDTPEHLREILDALDESMRRPMIILIEAPPRHGKTLTICHHMARYLRFRPDQQVAYASYSAPMALRKSRLTREIAGRAGVWSDNVKTDDAPKFDPSRAMSFWQTNAGGGLISGGRGGGFVGEGFGLIVIDDPFKNRAEAESEVTQLSVCEDMFEGTLFTRRAPGASMVITHQPWNDADLIAYLKEKFDREGIEYRMVSCPAVTDPEFDGEGRLTGGKSLWPTHYPIPELRIIQGGTSDYNFDSQYMCSRVPKGTKVFSEPQRYDQVRRDGVTLYVSCDPGIHENIKRDPTAIVEGHCYLDENDLVCIDLTFAIEYNEEIPETVDTLELRSFANGHATVLLEEVSAFRSVSQMARRLDQERVKHGESPAALNIVSIVPKGSKLVRSQGAAGAVKRGRIRVPHGAAWVPAFNKQLRRFTGRPGGKDNLVDALTQMYDHAFAQLGSSQTQPEVGGQPMIQAGAF